MLNGSIAASQIPSSSSPYSSSGPWEFNLAPGEPAVPLLQLLFFFLSRARIRNFTIYPRISRARCRAVSSILFILAAAVVDPGTLVEGGLVSNGSHFPAGHTCSPAQTGGALTRGEERIRSEISTELKERDFHPIEGKGFTRVGKTPWWAPMCCIDHN